jgi:transcriptional antiterminator
MTTVQDFNSDKKIILTFNSTSTDKTLKKYIKASLVSSELIDDKLDDIMSKEVYYGLSEGF